MQYLEQLRKQSVAMQHESGKCDGLDTENVGKRRRCKVMTPFKNTIVFQTKLAKRLAIYEEMKLKTMASHVEVVSQHIEKTAEQPNDVLIFKPSEADDNTGTILTNQPKAREM